MKANIFHEQVYFRNKLITLYFSRSGVGDASVPEFNVQTDDEVLSFSVRHGDGRFLVNKVRHIDGSSSESFKKEMGETINTIHDKLAKIFHS